MSYSSPSLCLCVSVSCKIFSQTQHLFYVVQTLNTFEIPIE